MLPFRKILFPVDCSEPCKAVVPYVREMIRYFSADLTLVHAYGPEALARSERAINDPELPADARSLEEQRLRQFALETFPGQHVESIAELAEPGGVVHRVVQHQGAAVAGHTPKISYESVLCAVDEGEEAEVVLRAAIAFASGYNAKLSLVHIVRTPVQVWKSISLATIRSWWMRLILTCGSSREGWGLMYPTP
jgi:nucleotide-binding universal stress UspA family protein